MPTRIEIGLKRGVKDARGNAVVKKAKGFLNLPLRACRTRDVYKLDVRLSRKELTEVRKAFTDPVVAQSAVNRLYVPVFDWLVEVGFKPGVTDNVGRTARALAEDVLNRKLDDGEQVATAVQYFFKGDQLTRGQMLNMARQLLANTLIQTIGIFSPEEWAAHSVDAELPKMPDVPVEVKTYDLSGPDQELLRISREGILSLSLAEMQAIRDYYLRPDIQAARARHGLPVDRPTDLELEALAQTWSEHCSHKIFAAEVDYEDEHGRRETIQSLFKTYIRGATEKVAEQIDWLVSVFVDNAGVIRFNDHLNVTFKCETHNSPSALDPYGGAITGIVGCNRDPMGTGMGSELLCNTWGYCLGSPFYEGEVPEGLFHPRIIRDGVHHGVIDGGNQSGIPYARGFECFDDRYIGKPLVYCGTVGLLPAQINGNPSEEKQVLPGDLIVMAGGRIGKDGIHGATFSSEELRQESPAQAVQIGDPITQRKLYEFIIEARDQGLFRAITDNGAGGLSSSVGEMAEFSGGMDMDLTHAPLKYAGMQPWEMYLSEAQERMTLAVQPEKIEAFLALAARRDVEATALGTFTDSGEMIIRYQDQVIARLDMEFLHDGCPRMRIPALWRKPSPPTPKPSRKGLCNRHLIELMARLNVCSKEYKARMYDHEVKGRTVMKPFTGVQCDIPGDATVLLAEYDTKEGIVVADGINPFYSDLDAYAMAQSCVDAAVRRIISVGGRLDRIAALDNFCWPDPVLSEKTPDGPYKMAQLVRANKGLYDITTAYLTPLISGKDSMKNDSVRGGRKISIPPTLLISTVGKMDDIRRAVSLSFKEPGDLIYVVGLTKNELGASEYFRMLAEEQGTPEHCGGFVPEVNIPEALATYRAMQCAVEQGLLRSSQTPTLGGLGAGFALCALGGDLGTEIDLSAVPCEPDMEPEAILFSESNSRFIVTCRPEKAAALEAVFEGVPLARVGQVADSGELYVTGGMGKNVVHARLNTLRASFKKTLDGI
ncbi:MAG: AIR synthase-related protein [Kiritimatiellae bacterium]|nr:AIR synthase-related protein [Kiritimatiellia bacterium]